MIIVYPDGVWRCPVEIDSMVYLHDIPCRIYSIHINFDGVVYAAHSSPDRNRTSQLSSMSLISSPNEQIVGLHVIPFYAHDQWMIEWTEIYKNRSRIAVLHRCTLSSNLCCRDSGDGWSRKRIWDSKAASTNWTPTKQSLALRPNFGLLL